MESRRAFMQLLVLAACCLVTAFARVATSLQEDEVGLPEAFFSHDTDVKRNSQEGVRILNEDISKLLLKHLRFRQLQESGSPLTNTDFASTSLQNGEQVEKRHEQRMLVNNLAALLSGLRDRQAESSMRMPSLRFGK